MGVSARLVEQSRTQRDEARERFDDHLERIRDDLEARSVGGRIADKVGEDARSAIDQAVAIADAHRGIVAGTIAALAVWFFRRPIVSGLNDIFGVNFGDDEIDPPGHRDEQGE